MSPSIARIWWDHRISNTEVRRRVFGANQDKNKLGSVLRLNRLRWLGHVLRMSEERLPRRALSANRGETGKNQQMVKI